MSKKRFIKLLMSQGIQRNSARKIAKKYNDRKIPYKIAYVFPYGLGKATKTLAKAISIAIKNVSAILETFKSLEVQQALKDKISEEAGE